MPSTITIAIPGALTRWLAVGLAVGLLVAAIASPAFAPRPISAVDPTSPPEHTISVSGTGKVVVSPDIADLRLGVSVTKPTVKAAREQAMAQAKSKAETLATSAGVRITGVASISETSSPVPYPVPYYGAAEAAGRDVSTPIQTGTNEVVVTVAVVYLID